MPTRGTEEVTPINSERFYKDKIQYHGVNGVKTGPVKKKKIEFGGEKKMQTEKGNRIEKRRMDEVPAGNNRWIMRVRVLFGKRKNE